MALTTERIEAPFGIQIDCDLTLGLEQQERDELVTLFRQHALLRFRAQDLSLAQQRRAMSYFGPVLRTDAMSDYLANGIDESLGVPEYKQAVGTSEIYWHSDGAYAPEPIRAISLHAVNVDKGVTSTRFISAVRAYEMLPESLRERLRDVEATHARAHSPAATTRSHLENDDPRNWPEATHPVVYLHPHTGEPLIFVNEEFTESFVGSSKSESNALMQEIFGHLYAPDNLYEHEWLPGDLVIWDNVALQHSRGSLGSGRRSLQRVVIAGDDGETIYPSRTEVQSQRAAW